MFKIGLQTAKNISILFMEDTFKVITSALFLKKLRIIRKCAQLKFF